MTNEKIPVSSTLYVGASKPCGFGAQFYAEPDGTITSTLTLDDRKQGPPGFAHGGSLATLLDEAMGIAAWYAGNRVLAVNLNINFRQPVPLNTDVFITAQVERVEGRKVFASSQITLEDGHIAVEGTGLFVTAPSIVGSNETHTGLEPGQNRSPSVG